MDIKITKRDNSAVLISFSAQSSEFESNYERNKFYNGLYGRIQRVRHGDDVYKYRREGLLDEVPHIKVDKSVFIVDRDQTDRVLSYFREWKPKVEYKTFRVLLEPEERNELERRTEIEIE